MRQEKNVIIKSSSFSFTFETEITSNEQLSYNYDAITVKLGSYRF